jgi:hypothetical protein
MLMRNLGTDSTRSAWHDLSEGAPTIAGFASLCGRALSAPQAECSLEELSEEAKTILVAATPRGTIDIRANRDSFDSAERFLAVCVEYELDQRLLFLDKSKPQQTIRFLEGFRELCQQGMVIHHLQRDFSLTQRGFAFAEHLVRDDFKELLAFGVLLEH